MNEAVVHRPAEGPPDVPGLLAARLDALREAGATVDPVRLHYLQVLAQRTATAPEAMRPVLTARLDTALKELEASPRATPALSRLVPAAAPAAPLAELNRYLRGLHERANRPAPDAAPPAGNESTLRELASVTRFRETWSRIAAEDQVAAAVERGPANAGPLNSHMLVLRTLARLRDLSPHYLRRFLSQVETLQWLEQASQRLAPVKPKPARRSRVKK